MGVSPWPEKDQIQGFLKDTAFDGHTNDGAPLKAMNAVIDNAKKVKAACTKPATADDATAQACADTATAKTAALDKTKVGACSYWISGISRNFWGWAPTAGPGEPPGSERVITISISVPPRVGVQLFVIISSPLYYCGSARAVVMVDECSLSGAMTMSYVTRTVT